MGLTNLKARFRAWLIDLVREAIRRENLAQIALKQHEANGVREWSLNPTSAEITPRTKIATKIIVEPSFEQMQAEAIQAQEKFYEPEPR